MEETGKPAGANRGAAGGRQSRRGAGPDHPPLPHIGSAGKRGLNMEEYGEEYDEEYDEEEYDEEYGEGYGDEYNPYLREAILEVVENQIRDNQPPETRQTLLRLMREGYSVDEAMSMIGTVLILEIYDFLKEHKPFNHERFARALERLPELPLDDDE